MEKTRFEVLDLIRGLCAVAIAVYHYLAWTHEIIILSMGTFGVYIFFILSSLTMMIRYGENFRGSVSTSDLKDFIVARVARILPLLAFVALVSAGINLMGDDPVLEVVSRAFLTGSALMALQLPGYLSNSTGAWTLGIETAFYMVFPLVALFANAVSLRALSVTLIIAILGQQALLYLIAPLAPKQHWQLYTTPLTFAPFFLLGLVIFRLRPSSGMVGFIGSLMLLAAVFATSLLTDADVFRSGYLYLGLTAVAAGVIYFAFGAAMPKFLHPFATFLGNISYSVYLTHWFIYVIINKLVNIGAINKDFQFVAFIVAAVAMAWAVFFLFENPARKWIRAKGSASIGPLLPS